MFSGIFTSSKACSSAIGSGAGSDTVGCSLTGSDFLVFTSGALVFSLGVTLGFSCSLGFSSCFIIFNPSFFPGFVSTFFLLSAFCDLVAVAFTFFADLIFFSVFSSLVSAFFVLVDFAWVFAVVTFTFEVAFIFIFAFTLTSLGLDSEEAFGEKRSLICCAASSSTELI